MAKKMKLEDIIAESVDNPGAMEVIEEFKKLREAEEYGELGNFFWCGFGESIAGNKEKGELLSKLWDTLTKKEQEYCE